MVSKRSIPEFLTNNQAEDLKHEHLREIVKTKYETLLSQNREEKINNIEEMLENKREELRKKMTENVEDKIEKLREREKEKLEKENKTMEKQTLAVVQKCFEASTLLQRRADESEFIFKKAIWKSAKTRGIPLIVLQGIQTYEHTAKFLTDLGVQCSILGKKEN
jgi:hypothetical protein